MHHMFPYNEYKQCWQHGMVKKDEIMYGIKRVYHAFEKEYICVLLNCDIVYRKHCKLVLLKSIRNIFPYSR